MAVTCLLLSAKIEESIAPSTVVMLNLLAKRHGIALQKKDIFELEERIIRVLDFSLRRSICIDFLERYYRLFGLDPTKDYRAKQIGVLSYDYCKFM